MNINFGENRLLFKNPKDSKKSSGLSDALKTKKRFKTAAEKLKAEKERKAAELKAKKAKDRAKLSAKTGQKFESGDKAKAKLVESKDKKAQLDQKYQSAKDQLKGTTKKLTDTLKYIKSLEAFTEDLDSVKKLRERIKVAPIGLIEKLEDKYPGITIAAFTTHLKGIFKLNPKQWSSDVIYSKFKPNTFYTIQFLGNDEADRKWGWADMAKAEWRGMTKLEGGNPKLKRMTLRRIGLKGQNKGKNGCYDSRGYIEIHPTDKVAYHNNQPDYTKKFRKKVGAKYGEIDADSYAKYAKSKYAKEDEAFFKKYERTSRTFLPRRTGLSREKILEIRQKIGSLKGLSANARIVKVVKFLTKPENNISARNCGNWAEKVRVIAGVAKRETIHHDISYAFVGGDLKKGGWKPEDDPSRKDCRKTGKCCPAKYYDMLKPGYECYANIRRSPDKAGNHRIFFVRWIDKKNRIAEVASWFKNKPGGQKLHVYDFNKYPLTAIFKPTGITNVLPEPRVPAAKMAGGKAPGESAHYIPDASKRELIARGSIPFAIRRGYQLTPEEHRWYISVRREAYRRSRLDINRRWAILQDKYQLMDSLRHGADTVGLRKKDWNFFFSWHDALQYCESGGNTHCFNRRKSGGTSRVALSSAAGEYQILRDVWRGMKKYVRNDRKGRWYQRQMRRYGIDPEKLKQVDFSAPTPELATPYQRSIYFTFANFRYSRIMKGAESIDNIFDKIRSTEGRMKSSWTRVLYTYWRNGIGGARPFIRNLRRGIPLPESRAEALDYFENYLRPSDWQKKRGFNDFWMLMRVTFKFRRKFNKNLRQLEA